MKTITTILFQSILTQKRRRSLEHQLQTIKNLYNLPTTCAKEYSPTVASYAVASKHLKNRRINMIGTAMTMFSESRNLNKKAQV
jgi:hypothetical protein